MDNDIKINSKLQAAAELGLTIEQTYSLVTSNFFIIINVKKDNDIIASYSLPADKTTLLANYETKKIEYQDKITELDNEIIKIEAVKEVLNVHSK